MEIPIGLGMLTVRESSRADFQGTLNKLGQIGYEYIEIVRHGTNPEYTEQSAKDLKKRLDEAGLKIIASHENILDVMTDQEKEYFAKKVKAVKQQELFSDEAIIEYNLEAGNKGGVVCAMAFYNDEEMIKRTAARMNEFGRKCVENGLKFYYHNHFQEFEKRDGVLIYDRLLKEFDERYVKIELDAFWAERGGMNPVELVKKLGNRCELIHVKDVNGSTGSINLLESMSSPFTFSDIVNCSFQHPSEFTEVGEGILKVKELVEQAGKSGVKCLIVEQDMMNKLPEMESVAISYKNLKEMTKNG